MADRRQRIDPHKLAIHRVLTGAPEFLATARAEATRVTPPPKDEALRMAYDNGRRAAYAELISVFNEVEEHARLERA